MKNKLFDFVFLYFCFILYSLASVFAKFASQQKTVFFSFFFVLGEIIILVIYAILWQQVLKRFQLVVAMSNKGITVIFTLLWSFVIFHERITAMNIIGAIIIMIGIGVVSSDV